jgi:hypothetical protein
MRCKAHVRFLGEGVAETSPPYPTGFPSVGIQASPCLIGPPRSDEIGVPDGSIIGGASLE